MRLSLLFVFLPHLLFAQVDIAGARKMKSGKVVTVNGQVTASFGDLSFIQDHSGAIAVYGVEVAENDSISVTGKLAKFNGLLEVVIDSMMTLANHRKPIEPKLVTVVTDHEAELVRLQNITFPPTKLFFYPDRSGILLKSNDTIHYWIDENTDIAGYSIPATSDITGIVGRYGNRFQLVPRSHSDITSATLEQPQADNNFKVLNWNLEFFGALKYGPANDKLQLTNVATVLNSTHADVMALQEISNDEMFRQLIQQLPGYNGRCSNRYSYSFDPSGDFPPQKLCFAYNTSTIKVVREKVLLSKYFDEHPSDIFSSGRLPYLLEVEARGRHLYFVNIHAKSGYDRDARNRRIIDSRILKDTLDNYYKDKDIILLGDFNDVPDSSYENFIDDVRYECISKSLNEGGWHSTIAYDDVIDHEVVSSSIMENYVSTRIVNVFSLIPLYAKTTSDHLPVISDFDLTKTITGTDINHDTRIFPNPAHNELWFQPANSQVVLMNSLGSVIYKNEDAHPPISLSEYAPGLYYLILNNQFFPFVKN